MMAGGRALDGCGPPLVGVLACSAPRPGDSHRGGQEEERGTRTHGDDEAARRSRRGLGSGVRAGARGWLLGLRGRGCDGEGIDRCGHVDERPDRSLIQGEKRLFDIAFEEGLIAGGDGRTFFGSPVTVGQVAHGQHVIQVLVRGVGVAVGVVDRREPDFEFFDGGVFEGGEDLVEVDHGRAYLQVAGFIEGIKRVARLPKIVGFDVAIAAHVTDLDKVAFC